MIIDLQCCFDFCCKERKSAFSSVQSLSRVRLFATPWIAARQASLSITNSQNLLKLMSLSISISPPSWTSLLPLNVAFNKLFREEGAQERCQKPTHPPRTRIGCCFCCLWNVELAAPCGFGDFLQIQGRSDSTLSSLYASSPQLILCRFSAPVSGSAYSMQTSFSSLCKSNLSQCLITPASCISKWILIFIPTIARSLK